MQDAEYPFVNNFHAVAKKLSDAVVTKGPKRIRIKSYNQDPVTIVKRIDCDKERYTVKAGGTVLIDAVLSADQDIIYLLDYDVALVGFNQFEALLRALGASSYSYQFMTSTLDDLNSYVTKSRNMLRGVQLIDLTGRLFCGRINTTEENDRVQFICGIANVDLTSFVKFSRSKCETINKLIGLKVFNLELLTMHNNHGFEQASRRLPLKLANAVSSALNPGAITIGRDTLYDDDSLSKGGYVLCSTKRFAAIASGELAYATFRSLKAEKYTKAVWEQWERSGDLELWTSVSAFPFMYCAACPTAVIQELEEPSRFKLLTPADVAKIIADINNESDFDLSDILIPKPKVRNLEDFEL